MIATDIVVNNIRHDIGSQSALHGVLSASLSRPLLLDRAATDGLTTRPAAAAASLAGPAPAAREGTCSGSQPDSEGEGVPLALRLSLPQPASSCIPGEEYPEAYQNLNKQSRAMNLNLINNRLLSYPDIGTPDVEY